MILLADNRFHFASKEDFRPFEATYAADPSGFSAEIQRKLDELTTAPSFAVAADRLRYLWTSVNLMELCVYFGLIPDGFPALARQVTDLIHDLRINEHAYRADETDLTITTQAFRLTMTLIGILNQSFGKGSYGKWHFGTRFESPFLAVFPVGEVTNTLRACLYGTMTRHAGGNIHRVIADVNRARLLCDRLYGTGLETLLVKNPKESAIRKLAVFYRVNLNTIADRILTYYDCTTGNQKRRCLQELEAWYGSSDGERTTLMDDFLSSLHTNIQP